jgi:hypothetical protein
MTPFERELLSILHASGLFFLGLVPLLIYTRKGARW